MPSFATVDMYVCNVSIRIKNYVFSTKGPKTKVGQSVVIYLLLKTLSLCTEKLKYLLFYLDRFFRERWLVC